MNLTARHPRLGKVGRESDYWSYKSCFVLFFRTHVSDGHFPDDKLGKWGHGLVLDIEGAPLSGHKRRLCVLWPVRLTLFLK